MTQYYEPEARALEEAANRLDDPALQNRLWAAASMIGTRVELDDDGDEIWPKRPTARTPFTVTLCWTPDQNFGAVAVYPSRAPLAAVLGLLKAGETPANVAAEHGMDEDSVQVLSILVNEIDSEDGS